MLKRTSVFVPSVSAKYLTSRMLVSLIVPSELMTNAWRLWFVTVPGLTRTLSPLSQANGSGWPTL